MNAAILLAITMATGSAGAQQSPTPPTSVQTADVDSRWTQWLGCWSPEDNLPDMGLGLRVCITPEQTTGVNWQTLVGAQPGAVDTLVPNGVARAVSDTSCTGTERSEWSKNGQHVFRLTDVTCAKEGARSLASVSFLTPGPVLVSVQFVASGPTKSVRVQRYRRAFDQTLANGTLAPQPSPQLAFTAPAVTDAAWSVDDVIEASRKLPADAVQAALTEAKGAFDLNKTSLLAMSRAGVSEGVIDLMVALTYPKRLVVQRASGGGSAQVGIGLGGGWYDPFYGTIASGSYSVADCYSPFGYGYMSYYDPCRPYYSGYGYGYGYPGYGYYPGYSNYGYGGGWVIVDPGPTAPAQPAPAGRVINGSGYTQVRPRESETRGVRTGSSGTSGSNADSSGGSNSGSSSGTSGVSSGGYSGGGSSSGGDSGARTAIPRLPDEQ